MAAFKSFSRVASPRVNAASLLVRRIRCLRDRNFSRGDTALSGLVLASPVSRTGSDNTMKGSRERGLVSESAVRCHIAKR